MQYWLYVSDVVTGNWGRGFPVNPFGRPDSGPEVAAVVSSAAPVSAIILLGALVVQSLFGIVAGHSPPGTADGRRRVRPGDAAGRDAGRRGGLRDADGLRRAAPVVPAERGRRPRDLRPPILALAALSTGYVALLTRAELRETLMSPFVKAARGRGCGVGGWCACTRCGPR